MKLLRLAAPAMLALIMLAAPGASKAGVFINITVAPPPLPVYDQPVIPGPDYIWTPGYWAWDPDVDDYYWVPGAWELAPEPGLLWTPGYWGWDDGVYVFHDGYWGTHVGFYGGVVYGFGYTGVGFEGGYWAGGVFQYNRSCSNINIAIIHNTYNKTVIVNKNITNVSFNGGTGGTTAKPTPEQLSFANEKHFAASSAQTNNKVLASQNKSLFRSANGGKPPIVALAKTGNFSSGVAAKSAGSVKPAALTLGKGTGPKGTGTNSSNNSVINNKNAIINNKTLNKNGAGNKKNFMIDKNASINHNSSGNKTLSLEKQFKPQGNHRGPSNTLATIKHPPLHPPVHPVAKKQDRKKKQE